MKKLIFLLSLSMGFSTELNLSRFEPGIRENGRIRVWIYFQDKANLVAPVLSQRQKNNRLRAGRSTEANWYDIALSEVYLNQIEAMDIDILRESKWLNAVSVLVNQSELLALNELSFVKKLSPIHRMARPKLKRTSQPIFLNMSREDTLAYGYAQAQIEQINVHTAHENGYYGQGVRILVMDTGFDLTHTAFDSLNLIAQRDFINNDDFTGNETDSEFATGQDSHGTAVLSSMASYYPDSLIGPAFKSEILLAKTEMVAEEIQGEEDNYVAGLEWGEANGAQVVSTSLGYLDWYTYDDMDGNTAVTTNAIDIAAGLGLSCVTAAGNEGYNSWYYIIAPADADSVIAVGAVDVNDNIAYFSSYGPTSDGRIKPEICARGVNTWAVEPGTDTFDTYSGTSLATPLVGGAVAVILSAHPDWSPMQIREALMMTADHQANPDNHYGYGIIDTWGAINYSTVSTDKETVAQHISVLKTYPNPFNPSATIRFSVEKGFITSLHIYDINGRMVETLIDGIVESGIHEIQWNAGNQASGIYFVRLES
ncbi:MAG: S8 family serine peptidase, partial [Candidatus Marinimicrobia bacterium]|nr:S8 family serine peptidase [Candidatus Neomarinimicrobiota bacterium]MBT4145056.1 S8 family serine peptidase [Candidatus Neomarinimicrobiota bacterium]MBT4178108.1 S8 family serine peptidase [Candidatus Neomarinimicrobiota bacterium]MBT6737650.1 S8 family serine peptidase [Candidatus Neomarinimicrobiota bacterium]MBT6915016.1 S8 family serine peptidase [Candidatus Neomarinimicrobiota bacterium]